MKRITLTLQLDESMLEKVETEARQKGQSLEETFRNTIARGLAPEINQLEMTRLVVETWKELGPAPEIDYARLQEG